MPDTVPVTIEVEPDAAAALADPVTRAAVGRLVSRVLEGGGVPGGLVRPEAQDQASEAAAPATASEDLATAFRGFRRGRRLGGLDPKSLVREGLT